MKKLNLLATVAVLTLGFMVTSSPANAEATQATQNFVKNAAIGSQFEILSSRMALEKSQNPTVKQFAQKMIEDHTKADSQLKTTLPSSSAGLASMPSTLDSKHQQVLDRLKAVSGSTFDQEYLKAQMDAHQHAVTIFQDYATNGDDPVLKNFSTQTLPVLKQHQEHVTQLNATLS